MTVAMTGLTIWLIEQSRQIHFIHHAYTLPHAQHCDPNPRSPAPMRRRESPPPAAPSEAFTAPPVAAIRRRPSPHPPPHPTLSDRSGARAGEGTHGPATREPQRNVGGDVGGGSGSKTSSTDGCRGWGSPWVEGLPPRSLAKPGRSSSRSLATVLDGALRYFSPQGSTNEPRTWPAPPFVAPPPPPRTSPEGPTPPPALDLTPPPVFFRCKMPPPPPPPPGVCTRWCQMSRPPPPPCPWGRALGAGFFFGFVCDYWCLLDRFSSVFVWLSVSKVHTCLALPSSLSSSIQASPSAVVFAMHNIYSTDATPFH